jgi:hypothetical protein
LNVYDIDVPEKELLAGSIISIRKRWRNEIIKFGAPFDAMRHDEGYVQALVYMLVLLKLKRLV